VLTDYHVHLRPDDDGTPAAEYFTAGNAERYRAVAEERGISELGVAEHIHRFTQSLDIWQHPWWRKWAHDDVDAYCEFVREETDLRLGIEADYVAGAEDRIANFLEERDWDYVVGSVHFLREEAVDMEDWSVWGRGESAEKVWKRYFDTLGQAAATGLYDIMAHPDLVKVWGRDAPQPEGDLRRYYEPAIEGFLDDYAFLAQALLDVFEITFDPTYLDVAQKLATTAFARFEDNAGGSFYSTAAEAPRTIAS